MLAVLVAVVALGAFLILRDGQPGRTVLDDFESGALTGWQAVGSGSEGWFVYCRRPQARPIPLRATPMFRSISPIRPRAGSRL